MPLSQTPVVTALLFPLHDGAKLAAGAASASEYAAVLHDLVLAAGGTLASTTVPAWGALFTRPDDALRAAFTLQRTQALWERSAHALKPIVLISGPVASQDAAGMGALRTAAESLAAHSPPGAIMLAEATYALLRASADPPLSVVPCAVPNGRAFQVTAFPDEDDVLPLGSAGKIVGLPRIRTPLLGRRPDLERLVDLIGHPRTSLVTITGPGGIGKTRLAIHAAAHLHDHFADGVWFIPCAALRDADMVVPTIAQHLGIPLMSEGSPAEHLVKVVGEKHLLLVLDNLEHIVECATDLLPLLDAPHVRLLVTSRVPLHLSMEQRFPLLPLELPTPHGAPSLLQAAHSAAVRLFVARAQAVQPNFVLTPETSAAVAAICQQLDGLPLAIELAAARTAALPLSTIQAQLAEPFDLLAHGPRDMPARHQTLRATIAWSYDLLPPAEQRLFRHLSLFVNGATLQAATAVCGWDDPARPLLDGLCTLVQQSLLQQGIDSQGEPRFWMFETIRAYAQQRAAAEDDLETLHILHAEYYTNRLALKEKHARALSFHQFADDAPDALHALQWLIAGKRTEHAMSLAAHLTSFWSTYGLFLEGLYWIETALALEGEANPLMRAYVLQEGTSIAVRVGRYDLAQRWGEQNLAFFRVSQDIRGIGNALTNLGRIGEIQRDYVRARMYHEESLVYRQAAHDQKQIVESLNNLGWLALVEGNLDAAEQLLQECLALLSTMRYPYMRALAHVNLGWIALRRHAVDTAAQMFEASLQSAQELGTVYFLDEIFNGLAATAALQGRYLVAAHLLSAATECRNHTGAQPDPYIAQQHALVADALAPHLSAAEMRSAEQAGRSLATEPPLAIAAFFRSEEQAVVPIDPSPPLALPQHGVAAEDRLTPREIEVVQLLSEGCSNAEIAERLIISPMTVNVHLRTIYRKLSVSSRTAAVRAARERHVIN